MTVALHYKHYGARGSRVSKLKLCASRNGPNSHDRDSRMNHRIVQLHRSSTLNGFGRKALLDRFVSVLQEDNVDFHGEPTPNPKTDNLVECGRCVLVLL